MSKDKEQRGGCLSKVLLVFVVLIFLSIISPNAYDENDQKESSANATAKVTATAKPTKTPKPTATPVPDFAALSLEESVATLVGYYCKDDFICTKSFVLNKGVSIDITVESFLTEKMMVRDCCRLYMNIARVLFNDNNASTLVINFDTPGRDQYGNETSVRAMEIFLNRDTALKINYDYMITNLGSTTNGFLQITDRYYVHPDLQKGVY